MYTSSPLGRGRRVATRQAPPLATDPAAVHWPVAQLVGATIVAAGGLTTGVVGVFNASTVHLGGEVDTPRAVLARLLPGTITTFVLIAEGGTL